MAVPGGMVVPLELRQCNHAATWPGRVIHAMRILNFLNKDEYRTLDIIENTIVEFCGFKDDHSHESSIRTILGGKNTKHHFEAALLPGDVRQSYRWNINCAQTTLLTTSQVSVQVRDNVESDGKLSYNYNDEEFSDSDVSVDDDLRDPDFEGPTDVRIQRTLPALSETVKPKGPPFNTDILADFANHAANTRAVPGTSTNVISFDGQLFDTKALPPAVEMVKHGTKRRGCSLSSAATSLQSASSSILEDVQDQAHKRPKVCILRAKQLQTQARVGGQFTLAQVNEMRAGIMPHLRYGLRTNLEERYKFVIPQSMNEFLRQVVMLRDLGVLDEALNAGAQLVNIENAQARLARHEEWDNRQAFVVRFTRVDAPKLDDPVF